MERRLLNIAIVKTNLSILSITIVFLAIASPRFSEAKVTSSSAGSGVLALTDCSGVLTPAQTEQLFDQTDEQLGLAESFQSLVGGVMDWLTGFAPSETHSRMDPHKVGDEIKASLAGSSSQGLRAKSGLEVIYSYLSNGKISKAMKRDLIEQRTRGFDFSDIGIYDFDDMSEFGFQKFEVWMGVSIARAIPTSLRNPENLKDVSELIVYINALLRLAKSSANFTDGLFSTLYANLQTSGRGLMLSKWLGIQSLEDYVSLFDPRGPALVFALDFKGHPNIKYTKQAFLQRATTIEDFVEIAAQMGIMNSFVQREDVDGLQLEAGQKVDKGRLASANSALRGVNVEYSFAELREARFTSKQFPEGYLQEAVEAFTESYFNKP